MGTGVFPQVRTGNINGPCLSKTSLSRMDPGLCTSRLSTRNSESCFHCSTVMRRAVRRLHRFSSWCRLQQQRTSFYPPHTCVPHAHPYACVQHITHMLAHMTHWHVRVCRHVYTQYTTLYACRCAHYMCTYEHTIHVCPHDNISHIYNAMHGN